MTMQPVPADTLKHFATLGLAWLDRLPAATCAMDLVHPSLHLTDQGVWRPRSDYLHPAYPDGLNLSEALGLTLVVRWVERCDRGSDWCPVGAPSRYGLWIEGQGWCEVGEEERLRVASAWLALRRLMRPPVPWDPSDPIAEQLQRIIRAASARLSPAVVTTIVPETIASDLGRDWSGGYGRSL